MGIDHRASHRAARLSSKLPFCRSVKGGRLGAKAHLLIVDDEANTLASLSRAFRLAGHDATVCDNPAKALELAKSQHFDLIFSDVVMPGKDGLTLLEELKAQGVTAPVVMMSGQAHIEMAVRATRLGALDFLEKPISSDKLLLTVENALKLQRLESENQQLKQRLGKHEIVWKGEAMRRVMAQLERVAASETRICILGETGTGKELVARTIHDRSARAGGPFVTLNCAAVPAELIESELFGHEKGSFTGAAGRHIGKFEQADRGTIFLDEIGDMPLHMQAKLLRVLEEGEVERIGGDKPVAVDVRVLVATHRDLEARVREEKFRQDLFHRIYVFPLVLPPLRERRDDIPALVEHFAEQVSAQNGWKPIPFVPEAMRALQAYAWPGNVRELRNMVERLMLLATEDEVDLATVQLALPKTVGGVSLPGVTASSGALADRVQAFEREVILAELKRSQHNVSVAAKSLGLERSHLYKKAEQLGIDLRALRREQEPLD
jgi:two-component system, NtrC family, nitrogen regulation response regulator NtrX